jgi:outer membrane protein TolC
MRKNLVALSLANLMALTPMACLSQNEHQTDTIPHAQNPAVRNSDPEKVASPAIKIEASDTTRKRHFTPLTLPAEPTMVHDINKSIPIGPFRIGASVQISNLHPIRLEAEYNQPIGLKQALEYALTNSLPIKITRESWNYQKDTLVSNFFSALPLPSLGSQWAVTYSRVLEQAKAREYALQPIMFIPVFVGGGQVYLYWAQYYRDKGWRQSFNTSVNDALLDVYQDYENLLLQYTLLKIREKSLEVSQAQLELNNLLYSTGTGTQFAIMQSRTQLASDKQAVQEQQVKFRQASMALAYALNLPLAINLLPAEDAITEQPIIDPSLPVDTLLNIALVHRPELRQFELFWLASKRTVQVATAPLYPTAGLFGMYTYDQTITTPIGTSAGSTAAGGVFGGSFDTTEGGYILNWSLPYCGLQTVANIISARSLVRQSELQANQEYQLVSEQVRASYLNALAARLQIDAAAYGVVSAAEGLRLADLRLRNGSGTNLELITSQKTYIDALTSQAQAIIASNIAQAQLLHNVGMISANDLVDGMRFTPDLLKPGKGKPKKAKPQPQSPPQP